MAEMILIQPYTGNWDEMSLRLPESLLAVASVPVDKGYDVRLIDQRVTDRFELDLEEAVGPETLLIGITAITGEQIKYALKVTQYVKDNYPHIPICWGGIHATLVPDQTASHELIDYVIVGDGEFVFCELYERLRDGKDISDLRGLVYKSEEGVESNAGTVEIKYVGTKGNYTFVRKNGRADVIRDMDALPPLPYHLIPFDKYEVLRLENGGKSATLNTSRGCPYRCKFCSDPVINEGKWRGYSPEKMMEKVAYLYDELGVRIIYFQDDYFPGSKKRFVTILEGLAKYKRTLMWGTLGIRADTLSKLSDEEWDLLYESGCHTLEIGIESGNPRVLASLNKAETLEEMTSVNVKLAEYDVKVKYTLIVGFPNETIDEIKDTLAYAAELERVNPNAYCLIFNFLPIIGTPFYVDALMQGFVEPKSLEEWGYMDFDKWMRHYRSWASPEMVNWLEAINFVSYFHSKNVAHKFSNSKLLQLCFFLYHPIARWRFLNSNYKFCIEVKLQQWLLAFKFKIRHLMQKRRRNFAPVEVPDIQIAAGKSSA